MLPGGVAQIEDHPTENLTGKSSIHHSAKFFRLISEIISFFRLGVGRIKGVALWLRHNSTIVLV